MIGFLAIRIWKLVFDGMHSDSELVRKLIDENLAQWAQSGVAHAPNIVRSQKLTRERAGAQMCDGASWDAVLSPAMLQSIAAKTRGHPEAIKTP